jgi:hypothetical protein
MSTQDQPLRLEEQDNNRRDFIRNSALAAGAIATAAAISVSPSASAQDVRTATLGKPKLLKATFDARYASKITKNDILLVLEKMFDIAGCPTCGLNGYDINLGVLPIYDLKIDVPVNLEMQI